MPNIANILEAQLDTISLRHLSAIGAVADSRGVEAYLVGGAVRDALLGLPVHDIDIVVVGLTIDFARHAARTLNARITKRSQFNTFALDIDGRRIDIAMARQEAYTRPGALPTVSPGMMEHDLARRDFSINAMAASINAGSFGDLMDPSDGQGDLRRNLVRVLHDASFRDDATRILRAARYAVRLGFRIDEYTERLAMRDAAYIGAISGARLRDEFMRALHEGRAVSILEMLRDLGALKVIHPALTVDKRMLSALRRAEGLAFTDKPLLYTAILAYAMNDSARAAFVERLSLQSRYAQVAVDSGLAYRHAQEFATAPSMKRSAIYARLNTLHEAAILGCAICSGGAAEQAMMLFLDELRHTKPLLNGRDLLALGVHQGPRLGEMLQALRHARLDGRVKTRQDEIDFIRFQSSQSS